LELFAGKIIQGKPGSITLGIPNHLHKLSTLKPFWAESKSYPESLFYSREPHQIRFPTPKKSGEINWKILAGFSILLSSTVKLKNSRV